MADSDAVREAYRRGYSEGYAYAWRAACLKLLGEVCRLRDWLEHGAATPIGTRCDPNDLELGEGQ